MAPEQVRGLAADYRADLFAFGAVLYEMLSGRRAFQGDTPMDVMMAVAREEPSVTRRCAPRCAANARANRRTLPRERPIRTVSIHARPRLRAGRPNVRTVRPGFGAGHRCRLSPRRAHCEEESLAVAARWAGTWCRGCGPRCRISSAARWHVAAACHAHVAIRISGLPTAGRLLRTTVVLEPVSRQPLASGDRPDARRTDAVRAERTRDGSLPRNRYNRRQCERDQQRVVAGFADGGVLGRAPTAS